MPPLDIADLSRYAARACHGHLVTGICRPCFEWWAEAPRDHHALAEAIRAELPCICDGKPERHGTPERRRACPFVVADELKAEVDRAEIVARQIGGAVGV